VLITSNAYKMLSCHRRTARRATSVEILPIAAKLYEKSHSKRLTNYNRWLMVNISLKVNGFTVIRYAAYYSFTHGFKIPFSQIIPAVGFSPRTDFSDCRRLQLMSYTGFYVRQHIGYDSIYAIARSLYAMAIPSVCLSVCPSVCPSVTRMDQSKTVEARITQFSPYSRPIPLVFRGKFHREILTGSPERGPQRRVG